MIIDVYSNIYNEEQILPYWLRHYDTFADRIFIWDDNSIDKTLEILKKDPKVILLPREKNRWHDDTFYVTELYPQYEKLSCKADWVIIADADEFIYHPNLREVLTKEEENGTEVIKCIGYTMIADKFPETKAQIYDEIKMGLPDRTEAKWSIFRANVKGIRFREGRHDPPLLSWKYRPNRYTGIKLLHYKYIDPDFIKSRDIKNFVRTKMAGKTTPEHYVEGEYRACPDGRKRNIFRWLNEHKKEAFNVVEDNLTDLCILADKYGSGKSPLRGHHYTPFYFNLFDKKRKSIKKVLEIGTGPAKNMRQSQNYIPGTSLIMWRDFFSNAKIFGADIDPTTMIKRKKIKTFVIDQTKKEDLKKLIEITGSDIDIAIDNGSGKPEDQVMTCKTLMPCLKKDVTYIIEDVIDQDILNELKDYDCQMHEFRIEERQDDRIIIVRHK